MRTAGFPCRRTGCDEVFHVVDQNSMTELHAASAARTAHEVTDHDYHHVPLSNGSWRSPYQVRSTRSKTETKPGGAA